MRKVVDKGIKIDLHIHSVYSKNKDGGKVANNTEENLPVLVKNLIKNEVNMCAITDHDNFNYNLYRKLKSQESENNCIEKVLPGIEFSVEFIEGKIIHIVTIFDDKDDEKIKNIENIMKNGKGNTCFKKSKNAYLKQDYFEILYDIGVDFIMIAHQKKTVTSQHKPHANDVMSLGKEIFNELVFTEYFDAYEFRNRKNEIYNKAYVFDNKVEEKLRFITGSDCHRWEFYPYTEKNEKKEFKFTYIKSLPTFKGLAMAVTDYHRIELENMFFNPVEKYCQEIVIDIQGKENRIPLSKGINVIIGDNSIGKSLFLYAITGDCKSVDRHLKKGYDKYIEKNGLEFKTKIDETSIFKYNQQGEIRAIFDDDGLKPDSYLSKFYPNEINASKYKKIVEQEFQKLFNALEIKFLFDEEVDALPTFNIPLAENDVDKLVFIENVKKSNTTECQKLVDSLDKIIGDMKDLKKNHKLIESDKMHLKTSIEMLNIMKEKYEKILEIKKAENDKINEFNTFIKAYKTKYNRRITDEHVIYSEYMEQKQIAIDGIVEIIKKKNNLEEYVINVAETDIVPETNSVDKYKFVSKLEIEKIDNNYIKCVIDSIIRKGKKIDTCEIKKADLIDIIKRYPSDEDIEPLEVLKNKVTDKIDEDFKVRNTIVENNMEVYQEVSAGFDSQMYFTLLSGETRDKGIYIIDQPEDHISQKAIKEKVLDQFRRMGQHRQVLMVTHNPQFIVNLDVDNVIYLCKENNEFKIKSGALEYQNEEYSILDIVADNIEGGLLTIQGRLKRYEKNI